MTGGTNAGRVQAASGEPTDPGERNLGLSVVATLAVLAGGGIYVLARSKRLLVFRWIESAGAEDLVDGLRRTVAPVLSVVPDWFLFCVPDGLFALSVALAFSAVWRGLWPRAVVWIPALTGGLGVLSELLQWTGQVPGTPDIADAAAYSLGALAAGLILAPREPSLPPVTEEPNP